MRTSLRWLGNLCIALSALGVAGVALVVFGPETAPPWLEDVRVTLATEDSRANTAGKAPVGSIRPVAAAVGADYRAITHLAIDSIGLSADVVPAQLIERNGATTWEVPAFKVGHAETTAGAGAPGNAVLLGHVTSVRSGNVFEELGQVHVDDTIQVFANRDRFDYRVVDVERVPRSRTDVLEQGAAPTVSLITCTGVWLPTIWDYTERLVVRAELVDAR
ncbi:MAG TPA: class F sortase [Chloroflexota bacterium]